jgi:hypothetical protein
MKTTIKAPFALLLGLACVSGSYAASNATTTQTTTENSANVAREAREGFILKNSQVMITKNGETKVMNDDMKLASGVEVRTDGSLIVPGGTRRVLNEGDSMSFDGTITRADGRVEHLRPH